jgi:hypothetical protein
MKISLEAKLRSCPNYLRCVVCDRLFLTNKIRTLLYSDRGLLQGDICSHCLRLKANTIRNKLREKALINLINTDKLNRPNSIHKPEALELLALSKERINFPSSWQWLLKKIEIFSQENRELESSRLGLTQFSCEQRLQLERLFNRE